METNGSAVNAVNTVSADEWTSPLGPIVMPLKPERVQEELMSLPGWQLTAKGHAIQRVAVDGRVMVTLSTPPHIGGLTQAVFDLARQLG
jgi:pterin-4a-carbinolamine dehydratase